METCLVDLVVVGWAGVGVGSFCGGLCGERLTLLIRLRLFLDNKMESSCGVPELDGELGRRGI